MKNVTNPSKTQIGKPSCEIGGGIDWCNVKGSLAVLFNYNVVYPLFTCVTFIEVRANSVATRLFDENINKKTGQARLHVFETLRSHFSSAKPDVIPMVSKQSEYNHQVAINGSSEGEVYSVTISVRLLGEDAGREFPADVSLLIEDTCRHMSDVLRGSKGGRVH